MLTLEEYTEIIKPKLKESRFIHSKAVASAAVDLAKRYGADVKKAETAGILHDIMKNTPGDEQLKMLSHFGIILSDIEKITPCLWHQISGAAYCRHVLCLEDDICEAVRWHTSGKKDMSLLEKVIFVADFISEDRSYPGVEDMREYACESLEKAMAEGLAFTIRDIAKNHRPIISDTIDAYNQAVIALI